MCPTSQSPFFKSTELTQQKRITHFATADQLPSPAVASEVARAAGIHVSTGSCRLDRLERFFCRNQYVCFRVRRGTCVAVGRYASGDVAYEWGACWVNLASARFRLESPRWFWGSSLNRQGRRQKGSRVRETRNRSRALSSMRARHLCSLFPRSARRPASVIRTRATLIDLPQLFLEDCGFLF